MFKHILVPLDGSRLAEAVFPHLIPLARSLHAEITLIHIIEKDAPAEIHGERHLTKIEEAVEYLRITAKSYIPSEIMINTHVHETEVNDVARSIVDHSSELKPDLIFISTHGSSGLRDFMVGTIAQQVIGIGKLPVILIRPQKDFMHEEKPFGKILVGLDGNPEHEVGMNLAAELARTIHAKLHLLTVINTLTTLGGKEAATGMLLPSTTKVMLDMAEETALEHLEARADLLQKQGLAVSYNVKRGEPTTKIVQEANEIKGDLIVLGTHGKVGLDAFWAGSVAPKIPSLTNIPLLFVPFVKTGN
jgi:nucleotide-binding universal stress UspA family protein